MKPKWTKEKQEALRRTITALEKVSESIRAKVSGAHQKKSNAVSQAEKSPA